MKSKAPKDPPIFHITHVDNLPSIVKARGLWSDAERISQKLVSTNIGHTHIKERRLNRDVPVSARGKLGEYVPFYFCSRSVMLYVISRGHQDYSGGQGDIVHLVSTVAVGSNLGRRWAFTERHAELGYAEYFDDLAKLDEVDWSVMPLKYWSDSEDMKQKRQAEFLVHRFFPWTGFTEIGVQTSLVADKVSKILGDGHPPVNVRPDWYY